MQPLFARCILLHLHPDAEAQQIFVVWLTCMERKIGSVVSPVVSSLKSQLYICSAVLVVCAFSSLCLPQSCLSHI